MSTNKTKNYQLHTWEPGDDFLREEFNANFAALDAALAGLVVAGSYVGDGAASRTIRLGFTPRAVLLVTSKGEFLVGAYTYGGLAVSGLNSQAFSITEGGFSVRYHSGSGYVICSNGSGEKYCYLALR
jgi:hypothetical protein